MSATKSSIRGRLLHEYQLGHYAAVGRRNVCAAMGQDVLKESTTEFWYKNRGGSTEVKDGQRAAPVCWPAAFTAHTPQWKKFCAKQGLKSAKGKVPDDLTASQKKRRFECARDLLDRHRKQPFLDRTVTCDETDCLRQPPHEQAIASSMPKASTGAKTKSERAEGYVMCVVVGWMDYSLGTRRNWPYHRR
ncbi:hypothetical protein ANCDUO_00693 [Ancylostoma duodenale]|uniref:Mos1 transposase HTH domain-containing protein n=1 Tax=Ancylostoma duodenale TaxID=51022 RepID=A0A0C2HBE2_9BILA|nr:hypothetical protein ANCDUO_00693 [Ancylostoma duodenale]